jgi:hypothetical protein
MGRRVPNQTLRTVRLALRMSQNDFATAIRHAGDALGEPNGATKRLVQKWESGEHAECRPHYRRALQSVTRMPYDQLGFQTGPGMAFGSIVVPPARIGTFVETRAERDEEESAWAGDACERLRFALERPGQADMEAITLVETATGQLFDLEHHRPARLLLPAVCRHVEDVAALLSGTRREGLRHRLVRTGGHSAALIGWLAFDRHSADGAFRAWDTATTAAMMTSDGPLLACVLAYQSYTAAERGDPATAWQLAHTAVAHAGPDARTRAWMAARAAQEAARLGERRAALAELDLAFQLGGGLAPAAPDDPSPPWSRFFYRAVLGAMAANVHCRLGHAQKALDMAGWALRTLGDDKVKTRALVLAEVACTHAQAGEIETAVESAHHALDLAEYLEVTLARRRLRTLIALLASTAKSSAAVRELLARISPEPP